MIFYQGKYYVFVFRVCVYISIVFEREFVQFVFEFMLGL